MAPLRHNRPNPGKPRRAHPLGPNSKPFKKAPRSGAGAAAAAVREALPIPDDDVDFPRGGRSLLSRQELEEARAEADVEFEKEARKSSGREKRKSKRKASERENDDFGYLFGEGISGKLPKYANRITMKNIAPNMKLWGMVIEVNEKDVVVSLPDGLRGYARSDEISDVPVEETPEMSNLDRENSTVSQIVRVNQLVTCLVLQVDEEKDGKGNKRIWLSLRLSRLHKGLSLDAIHEGMVLNTQVKSIEDHGYILHFGVPSCSGFLPRSNDGKMKFENGRLVTCVVKSIDKARAIVQFSCEQELLAKSIVKDLKGLHIDHLIPGMMVRTAVHSVLQNGLMLSFLSYFTGTVEIFHLMEAFPSSNWKDSCSRYNKVNARILFVDPSTRAIGLTMNKSLVQFEVPHSLCRIGDIYDEARILRIDKRSGLFVDLPTVPTPSAGYINIHDISDKEVGNLGKKFKEGTSMRVRVIGMRHLEGLAVCSSKDTAFEGSVFTHSDVKPGMLVRAKIISVEASGAIVQFPGGLKALCPLTHMSELDLMKIPKKFKVGAELLFRVLGCKSKRITVTHKKTLVKSKLGVLASYADATVGLVTHGWITKVDGIGCCIRFYNGVCGFAKRNELGLEPGVDVQSCYHVGQVVKCRIIHSIPSAKKLSISFITSSKSAKAKELGIPKLGDVVSGIVEELTANAVIVRVNGHMKGSILNEHLADCRGQASQLKAVLKLGSVFDNLLVLENEGEHLVLSAKNSLIDHAVDIPSEAEQIHAGVVVHGYITSIIESGVFVRFLGRFTGFAPRNKATDGWKGNLNNAFFVGQSVRSHVLDVDKQTGRVKLSLQQFLCSSLDVSFIQEYFLLDRKIAALQHANSEKWTKSFGIGNLVEGVIEAIKEFGVVLRFKNYSDIVGFIPEHQLGGTNVKVESTVKAVVLDASFSDGLVDLSLKSDFVGSTSIKVKKKRPRTSYTDLELHREVNAIVEMVKENYLILSLPEYGYAIGFASLRDYNVQMLPPKPFVNGQNIIVKVGALPVENCSDRLLLVINASRDSRSAMSKSGHKVGSVTDCEIVDIGKLELIVKLGSGERGRIHISEVLDDNCSVENPFDKFNTGQLVRALIIAKAEQSKKHDKRVKWELSLKPSLLTGDGSTSNQILEEKFPVGSIVRGYVMKVDSEWMWLSITRNVVARSFILDSSSEPSELQEFHSRYSVGQAVRGYVIGRSKEKNILRIKPFTVDEIVGSSKGAKMFDTSIVGHVNEGDIIGGQITKILPGVGGIVVKIAPHLYGKVHYTELVDSWVDQPLSELHDGLFVKCKVLSISQTSEGSAHVDLSIRTSMLATESNCTTKPLQNVETCSRRYENAAELCPGTVVQGYVKNVSSKGCFMMLSRFLDARIVISNLSDDYIEDPVKSFSVGKLICGRVLSVDSSTKRIEVTLKKGLGEEAKRDSSIDFSSLHVGDVVGGVIRRVEFYGLFIAIQNTKMVGLCHKSELSNEPLEDLTAHFKVGDTVKVKILKVDEERQRISLGMKQSYVDAIGDDEVDIVGSQADAKLDPKNDIDISSTIFEVDNGNSIVPQKRESGSQILPLQVLLDDSEGLDYDNDGSFGEGSPNRIKQTKDSKALKRSREEREKEIAAAEERALLEDKPTTEDEYEKLARCSPNSSFVWIQYIAFMLEHAGAEKARSIAERALRTIKPTEETEKFNVWVAYFNLESQYGSPPVEAVKKLFDRALQTCDKKKVYLALLDLYERTGQNDLAEDHVERMAKKFKTSCKVWLHRFRLLLKLSDKGDDELQALVNRALLSLPQNKRIKFLSHTAILEFKCGKPDRGRSRFEILLREYPKRMDLWSIYLDQEIRLGDAEVIRALFERATCLSLPPRKMKFIFSKYLTYERCNGDEDRVNFVKSKVEEYARSYKQ